MAHSLRIERLLSDLASAERTLERVQEELTGDARYMDGDYVFYSGLRAQISAMQGRIEGREEARAVEHPEYPAHVDYIGIGSEWPD